MLQLDSSPGNRVLADCSGPWRHLVDPPTGDFLGTKSKSVGNRDVIQRNVQPLCRDSGRSRAIVSGWLFVASLGALGLSSTQRRDVARDPALIDVT